MLSHPYDATKSSSEKNKEINKKDDNLTVNNKQSINNRTSNISEAQIRKLDVLLPPKPK